jgi:glyoxylase-like metal-dependent hydrolase (beta-lactamase superfamily II)
MTYHCTLLRAGRLLLDAGGMFGLIPRVVWETMVDPDDKHRVELHHNCLWLVGTQDDPELGRPRQVVIEAGTGDKLDPKMAGIFGLDGRTVETALTEAGGDPSKIDDVVISHLHFDHAGGLTRRLRPGESPDWTAGPKERRRQPGEADLSQRDHPRSGEGVAHGAGGRLGDDPDVLHRPSGAHRGQAPAARLAPALRARPSAP